MEEDIEMLETELEEVVCLLVEKRCFEYAQQIGKAIENLIKGYRELKETYDYIEHEHDRLDKRNNELIFELKDSIPKSKIKEKIEDLESKIKATFCKYMTEEDYYNNKFLSNDVAEDYEVLEVRELISNRNLLQELMEEE